MFCGGTVIGFDHGYVRVLGDGKKTTAFIVSIEYGWDEWVMGSGGSVLDKGEGPADGRIPAEPPVLGSPFGSEEDYPVVSLRDWSPKARALSRIWSWPMSSGDHDSTFSIM